MRGGRGEEGGERVGGGGRGPKGGKGEGGEWEERGGKTTESGFPEPKHSVGGDARHSKTSGHRWVKKNKGVKSGGPEKKAKDEKWHKQCQ